MQELSEKKELLRMGDGDSSSGSDSAPSDDNMDASKLIHNLPAVDKIWGSNLNWKLTGKMTWKREGYQIKNLLSRKKQNQSQFYLNNQWLREFNLPRKSKNLQNLFQHLK